MKKLPFPGANDATDFCDGPPAPPEVEEGPPLAPPEPAPREPTAEPIPEDEEGPCDGRYFVGEVGTALGLARNRESLTTLGPALFASRDLGGCPVHADVLLGRTFFDETEPTLRPWECNEGAGAPELAAPMCACWPCCAGSAPTLEGIGGGHDHCVERLFEASGTCTRGCVEAGRAKRKARREESELRERVGAAKQIIKRQKGVEKRNVCERGRKRARYVQEEGPVAVIPICPGCACEEWYTGAPRCEREGG